MTVIRNCLWLLAGVVLVVGAGCKDKSNGDDVSSRACTGNADCPIWAPCGSDGTCEPVCTADGDCAAGEVCFGGVGCVDASAEPPVQGPLRDVVLPDTGNITLTYTGCELDFDCGAGSGCVDGECRPVDLSSADCQWDGTGPVEVRTIVDGSVDGLSSLTPGLACGVVTDTSPYQVQVLRYGGGVLSVERWPIADSSRSTFWCYDVEVRAQQGGEPTQYIVVLGGTEAGASDFRTTEVLTRGDATPINSIPLFDEPELSDYMNPGRIIHGDGGRMFYGWTNGGTTHVRQIGTGNPADAVALLGQNPDGLIVGDTMYLTTRTDDDPVIVPLSDVQSYTTSTALIPSQEAGIGMHRRPDGQFGWFSVDAAANFAYWTGNASDGWVREDTGVQAGHSNFGSSLFGDDRLYYQVIASVTSEPSRGQLRASFVEAGLKLVFTVAETNTGWKSRTDSLSEFGSYILDAELRAMVCDQNIVEVVTSKSSDIRSWIAMEVR